MNLKSLFPKLITLAGLVLVALGGWLTGRMLIPPTTQTFDGNKAYQDILYQMSLGPRVVGTQAHADAVKWMVAELERAGWQVEVQDDSAMGHPIQNVVARRGSGRPWIILGAHYDSRMAADQDPNPANRILPVPGANDGASGVAVLLELARVLPANLNKQVWLVFFDAEDNGDLPGWDWLLGSRAFVSHLQGKPDAAIVIDMIGDANLDIYMERNSNQALTQQIWAQAALLGYQKEFIPTPKYSMLDDHTPFLEAGIPAVDIIDFDYPYWHTTMDTADKVSANSLKIVGDTLIAWMQKPE